MNSSAPKTALLLQGGGALGAYHIGAYQALSEAGMHPDWVAGVSIGSINAAVIVGTPPDERVSCLTELWNAISWPDFGIPQTSEFLATMHNWISNAESLMFGQPNFFKPRPVSPLLLSNTAPDALSYYDTSPMLATLARFADFKLINEGKTRLSLGTTNILTGDLEFFDNQHMTIEPAHVMASGSLPPGFPATAVNGGYYWDGGCVSNSPLDIIVDDPDRPNMLVFMINLWSAAGKPPTNMNEVAWRAKQIQYASRTAHQVDAVASKVNLRHAIRLAKQACVPEVQAVSDASYLTMQRLDIVHITYQPSDDQIPNSDAEFSRSSIAERRAAGYEDMKAALAAEPWRTEKPAHLGALVHRVQRNRVTTLPEPNLGVAPKKQPAPPRNAP